MFLQSIDLFWQTRKLPINKKTASIGGKHDPALLPNYFLNVNIFAFYRRRARVNYAPIMCYNVTLDILFLHFFIMFHETAFHCYPPFFRSAAHRRPHPSTRLHHAPLSAKGPRRAAVCAVDTGMDVLSFHLPCFISAANNKQLIQQTAFFWRARPPV